MKRVIAFILLATVLFAISGCAQIRIPQEENAVLTYREQVVGSAEPIVKPLTAEESTAVRSILMAAKYNAGIGGCAFTKEISFTFGEQVFAVAYDGCATVWDIQNGKYYEVDDEDWEYIVTVFERYGGRI